jgi:putative membrane protein
MIQYDPHNWMDHFFDVRGSLVKEISVRVLLCVGWSALVVLVHKQFASVAIPSLLHTLVGLPLGLLLVFRTNASYDRFWEGRKLWGGIVNETRNLARAASVHLRGRPELLMRVARWTAVFPWAAMNALRGQSGLGPLENELPADAAQRTSASQHPALAAAMEISQCLNEAKREGVITEYVEVAIDQNVQLLVDYLGGCERIRKTPLPFAYAVHLRRALVLYCFTLPFALVDTFGWTTVLDVVLLSYTFFGIEEIGVEIEGPFGHDANDLPLEEICETIHKNVFALTGAAQLGQEALPEGL